MGSFSRRQNDGSFLIFFLENRIWHFMQIVSLETICMKYQIIFSRKNKKNTSKCHLLKFLPSMQSEIVGRSPVTLLFERWKQAWYSASKGPCPLTPYYHILGQWWSRSVCRKAFVAYILEWICEQRSPDLTAQMLACVWHVQIEINPCPAEWCHDHF